jgi:branched-chain amino acid transport system permease protein
VEKFLQTLINAISLGSLYALIALGYTMVYGTLKFINFAHGTIFMLGAWLSYKVAVQFGWTEADATIPAWAAAAVLPIVVLVCGMIGFTVERVAYRPLRQAPRLNVLITAIGVALLLENIAVHPKLIGTEPQRMPILIPDVAVMTIWPAAEVGLTGGVVLRSIDLTIFLLAGALMLALQALVYKSQLGSAMRADTQDTRTASLLGINVDRTISITFLIGSSLAAAAGFLYAMKYPGLGQPSSTVWIMLGIKAFVAAVVGGIGNVRGAVVGGVLIGFIEMFGAAYYSPHLRDLYVFTILILCLLFRPVGLFGKATIEKV